MSFFIISFVSYVKVPLRLTPQILGVFGPLGTIGVFRESMVQVLALLRASPWVLLAIFRGELVISFNEIAPLEQRGALRLTKAH